jgi:exopolysaccharide biosynthesis polyprenyl glycosylphosphotransferase
MAEYDEMTEVPGIMSGITEHVRTELRQPVITRRHRDSVDQTRFHQLRRYESLDAIETGLILAVTWLVSMAANRIFDLRCAGMSVAYITIAVMILQLAESRYRHEKPHTSELYVKSIAPVVIASCLLWWIELLSGNWLLPTTGLVLNGVVGISAMLAGSAFKRHLRPRERNALIVGAGRVGQALARDLERGRSHSFIGFLDQNHHQDPRMLGKIENFDHIVRTKFIDDVFITIPSERDLVKRLLESARRHAVAVGIIPEMFDNDAGGTTIQYAGRYPIMRVQYGTLQTWQVFLKRMIDVVGATIGLMLTSPLLVSAAIAIKLGSSGPIFYRAPRIGAKGKPFSCLKFRTMVANADELRAEIRHLNERDGVLFKISADPRVTRVGRILRKYSIDEIPQFWNVICGEMSLVGPRPPLPEEVDQYSPEYFQRLAVRPGITGLWQVEARRDPSFQSYITLDCQYVSNWNLFLDVKIMLRTIPVVLRGTGE